VLATLAERLLGFAKFLIPAMKLLVAGLGQANNIHASLYIICQNAFDARSVLESSPAVFNRIRSKRLAFTAGKRSGGPASTNAPQKRSSTSILGKLPDDV